MNRLLKRTLRKAFYLLPYNRIIYRLCKRYVDNYNGENNLDMFTNGEIRLLRQILNNKEKKIVFDVGANVGQWTQEVLKINPSIYIHCFEPCSSSFNVLLEQDFPKNVQLNNFGLSSNPSIIEMKIYQENGGMNSIYQRTNAVPIRLEKIRLETLTNYCLENAIDFIDFVKIDVEGHDFDVLKGAAEFLADNKIFALQFEYGYTYIDSHIFLKDVFTFLLNFDYKIYKIFDRGLIPIKSYDQSLDNFQSSNFVLISNK